MSQNDSYSKRFLDMLQINGLVQIIDQATREDAILDLVITQTHTLANVQKLSLNTYFPSDHIPLFIRLKLNIGQTNTKPVTKEFRNFSAINYDEFKAIIRKSILSNISFIKNLNGAESVELYNSEIQRIMDIICPIKTKTFRRPKSLNWFNSFLQGLKQKKRKAERLTRKHPSNTCYKIEYKKARNAYTNGIKQTRTDFFSAKIQNCGTDSKKLHKVLNNITGYRKDTILPSEDVGGKTANDLAEFYVQKVEKIMDKIKKENNGTIEKENIYGISLWDCNSDNMSPTQKLSSFKQISMEQLINVVTSLKKKFCLSDPAPATVVIEVIELLYPIILQIVNSSISEAKFPDALKHAIVSPIIKALNLDPNIFQNLRPISSLPFVSKILEKVIHIQMVEHITNNGLYAKYQSAYRKNYSCETALTKIVSDIQELNFLGHNVILILLDQSAAFDTVNHSTLIYKLEHFFGIKDDALELIKSYLTNRTFSVKLPKNTSSPKPLSHGVPQGSLLGPLLYALYTAELESIISKYGLKIHSYADDTQIYASFGTNNWENVESNLQNCINEVNLWMNANSLMLNKNKTVIKVFYANKTQPRIDQILNTDVVDSVKVLGSIINENLKFKDFISKKVQICNMHLHNLYNIRNILDIKTKTLLITNLVFSTIDYCNILLIGCNQSELNPLKLIMNKCVRFILNLRYRTHVTPFYKKLHFLPINKRIKYKACLLAHKIYFRTAPDYLSNDFDHYEPMQRMVLREGAGRDTYMFTRDNNDVKNQLLYSKIRDTWNILPLSIRKVQSLQTFKSKLKTQLFD